MFFQEDMEFEFKCLQLSSSLLFLFQMSALKSANKELKGMMKTVKIQDIDVCILFPFLL